MLLKCYQVSFDKTDLLSKKHSKHAHPIFVSHITMCFGYLAVISSDFINKEFICAVEKVKNKKCIEAAAVIGPFTLDVQMRHIRLCVIISRAKVDAHLEI